MNFSTDESHNHPLSASRASDSSSLMVARRDLLRLSAMAVVAGALPAGCHAMSGPSTKSMAQSAASFSVGHLRVDYRENPLGIDNTVPRFFWQIQPLAGGQSLADIPRGVRQVAWQILVASSPMLLAVDTGDLWDSGKVESDATTQVEYSGARLTSSRPCWWKVRAWDSHGNISNWSDMACWSMGLLQPEDWQAQWIGHDTLSGTDDLTPQDQQLVAEVFNGSQWMRIPDARRPKDSRTTYFRREFSLASPAEVRRAVLVLTCDDTCDVWINGKHLGQSFKWQRAALLDMAPMLQDGINTLALRVSEFDGYSPNVLGRMVFFDNDGGRKILQLDDGCKAATTEEAKWNTTDFIDSHWFPVALSTTPTWHSTPSQADKLSSPPPYLRTEFALARTVRRATVYVTALGLYELYLNGQRVGNDHLMPGWTDFFKRVYYNTYDVTQMVKTGPNALGAILAHGWYAGETGFMPQWHNYQGYPRFKAQLEIEFTDGSRQIITSNKNWKAGYGEIISADIYLGSIIDFSHRHPGWNSPGFNDSAWSPVSTGLRQWTHNATMRTVHTEIPAEVPPEPKLQAFPCDPVRICETLSVQSVKEVHPGVWVFDFGQNFAGWVRLRVRGEKGDKITVRAGEMSNPDGTVYTTNLRGAMATDIYHLVGGDEEICEPHFTFHGFRYVQVTGLRSAPVATDMLGISVHTWMERTGHFASSSKLLNRIYLNGLWSQRGNYNVIPTDCPQRDERLGWMGDAEIFAPTACLNMNAVSYLAKWLCDVRDAQSPQGCYADVSPRMGDPRGSAPAWADAGTIIPDVLFRAFNDRRILVENYPAMRKFVSFIHSQNPDLLWVNHRGNDFGDWLNLNDPTPKELLATAYFANSAGIVARTAHQLGKLDDAAEFSHLAAGIKAAFNRAFVSANGLVKGDSQTGYVLSISFDLLPSNHLRQLAGDRLVEKIKERNWHLATGFLGVGHLLPALSDTGHHDVACRLAVTDTYPSWGYQVRNGATTSWERWDGWTEAHGFQDPSMNSFNHYSFGSIGYWMYTRLAGIYPKENGGGYQEFVLRPQPQRTFKFVNASFQSLHGLVVSAWKIRHGMFQWDVTVPANTHATVYLPTSNVKEVMESGRPVTGASGIMVMTHADGHVVMRVESGAYHFVSPLAPA